MAHIIIGGTSRQQRKRVQKIVEKPSADLNRNNPDFIKIESENSIGIEVIRQIKRFLSKKSWQGGSKKLVVVYDAHKMTVEAQNAFLKTLEEPPPDSLIILTVNNKTSLLPTIISRCQIIKIKTKTKQKLKGYWQKWQEITTSPLNKRLDQTPQQLEKWINNYILVLQKQLTKPNENTKQISNWLKELIIAKQMLANNVNQQRVADWLMIRI